ncbi:MAG: PLP-dependent aminotransferase family protein [Sporolactobacillus sp.]
MVELAKRMETMKRSADVIRKVFSSMTDPRMISFGGGAPAKEALPVEIVRDICNDLMVRGGLGEEALQYSDPQGIFELREVICRELLEPKGVAAQPSQVLVTTGGLETMNLICQIYINPGDVILVESPTFVHCVEIFEMFEAKCVAVETDDDGMVIDDVINKINAYHPKMIYVVPTFQNPTGKTLPADRREKLAQLASANDLIILEDDPYRDIRYSGQELPPIKSFDTTGHTILAGSFSKIFSPGCRLGYVVATEAVTKLFYQVQTATISHTSTLTQMICAQFFKRGYYPAHHESICSLYKERRDILIDCIDRYFPEGTKHTFPDGGLFVWVEVPDVIDTTDLLPEANRRLVSYVPGEGFYSEGGGKGRHAMRVSFSGVTPRNICKGMKILGELLQEKVKEAQSIH